VTPQEYWLLRELRFTQEKINVLSDSEHDDVLRDQYTGRIREIRRELEYLKVA
jgi:hypothetical protein